MTTYIEQHLIDPNPYQPRLDMEPVALNRLAEDIKLNGLLQPPAVRPIFGGRYQLIFGHRRAAAWRIAHGGGAPLPCEVRDMDDRQMFAAAIVENDDREALNAIEKARALQLYMTKFDSTQAAAAQLFGLKDQASVSNLLRLLRLPAGVQTHVATGDLPERYAREMIPLVNAVPEKALVALADKIAAAPTPGDAYTYQTSGLTDLLQKHTPRLNTHPEQFPQDWDPGVSTTLDGAASPLTPCTDCKFKHTRNYYHYCLRASCHAAKSQLYSLQQAREIAAAHHLPDTAIVSDDAKLLVGSPRNSFDGQIADLIQSAIDAGHSAIQLAPVMREGGNGDYWREQITGSKYVDVVIADGHTLQSIAKDLGKKQPKTATQAAAATDRADQRDAELKYAYEKLITNARSTVIALLPHFRSTLTLTPAIGAKLIDRDFYMVTEILGKKFSDDLKKAIDKGTVIQSMIVDAVIASILWNIADDAIPSWHKDYKPDSAHQVIIALGDFARANKLKLPSGWDSRLTPTVPAAKPAKKASKK